MSIFKKFRELLKPSKKLEGRRFVNRLAELGYFKYAQPNDIEILRQEWIKNFDPNKELISIWDDETGIPKDYRYYFCDGENLYERGGFTQQLKELKSAFNKIGLTMNVSDDIEKINPKTKLLHHSISINGKKYTIFENLQETVSGWGKAAKRLAEILNEELKNQNKQERVFLASGGNEGTIVFLTKEQFEYIDKVYQNKYLKPLSVDEWSKVMAVG